MHLVRAEAVHQLVHQDVREERVEADLARDRPRASATAEIGTSTFWNFASCTFFSITRFEPFSVMTRSSFGRLNAAVCTPRLPSPPVKTTLTTRIGASAPSFGLRYFGIDGQRVLEPLQLGAEHAELLRLGVVAQRDERFERRLVAEPLVFVGLVRADRRLDRGVELHPGHVAGVVVVREKRVGAQLEELLQRRLRRQRGGLAAAPRRRRPACSDTRRCTARP